MLNLEYFFSKHLKDCVDGKQKERNNTKKLKNIYFQQKKI